MKTRDDFTLEELRAMFAQVSDADQYEVLSAYFWAMRNAKGKGRK